MQFFDFQLKPCFNFSMIEKFIDHYESKAAFCRAVGIKHQQFLNQIIAGERPIPPKVCIKINELHNVPLKELRPDIYP